jgi:OFA family oxalate/formate antiporter-like MFS transporter
MDIIRSRRRVLILVCALVMQACLGATYSWPVFVKPLRDLTGLGQGSAQLPFTLFYFAFPASMMVAGWILPRLGPRRSAVLGGTLFGIGWIIASLGRIHFAFTVLGIGLIAGIGVGFAYIVPIAVCVQWFPAQKGLVTGIAVAGFGGGAALVSRAAGAIIQQGDPFRAFSVLGTVFVFLVPAAGLAMQYAPRLQEQSGTTLEIRSLLRRKEFRVLYGAMVAGLAAGFAVNTNLKELSPALDSGTVLIAVALFALANAMGRIVWGAVFDRIRPGEAIRINLFCQALVLLVFFWLHGSENGFLIFAFLAGFNYGGVLVIFASSAARIWGSEHVGQVYGLLFSANIAASPVAVLTGVAFDSFGDFTLCMVLLSGLLIAAALWTGRHESLLDSK